MNRNAVRLLAIERQDIGVDRIDRTGRECVRREQTRPRVRTDEPDGGSRRPMPRRAGDARMTHGRRTGGAQAKVVRKSGVRPKTWAVDAAALKLRQKSSRAMTLMAPKVALEGATQGALRTSQPESRHAPSPAATSPQETAHSRCVSSSSVGPFRPQRFRTGGNAGATFLMRSSYRATS